MHHFEAPRKQEKKAPFSPKKIVLERTINLQNRKMYVARGYFIGYQGVCSHEILSDSFVRFHNVVGRVVSNRIVPRG